MKWDSSTTTTKDRDSCHLTFMNEMKLCLDILEPIDQQIVKFQKDSVPISDVYDCWTMLVVVIPPSIQLHKESSLWFPLPLLQSAVGQPVPVSTQRLATAC
jgi:hypothetical protein